MTCLRAANAAAMYEITTMVMFTQGATGSAATCSTLKTPATRLQVITGSFLKGCRNDSRILVIRPLGVEPRDHEDISPARETAPRTLNSDTSPDVIVLIPNDPPSRPVMASVCQIVENRSTQASYHARIVSQACLELLPPGPDSVHRPGCTTGVEPATARITTGCSTIELRAPRINPG